MTTSTRREFVQAGGAGLAFSFIDGAFAQVADRAADLILTNGRIATLDDRRPSASRDPMEP
jgi:hypothetical protein